MLNIKIMLLAVLTNTTLWYPCFVGSALYLMSGCLFPASGLRSNSTGALGNSGTNGYNWSASPNSATNGYNLNFHSTAVNASNNNPRSMGMPVRPVQAFTNANHPTALYLDRMIYHDNIYQPNSDMTKSQYHITKAYIVK